MKKTLIIVVADILLQIGLGVILIMMSAILTGKMDIAAVQHTPAYTWAVGASLILTDVLMCVIVYFLMKRPEKNPFAGYFHLPRAATAVFSIVSLFVLMFFLSAVTELLDLNDLVQREIYDLSRNPVGIIAITLIGPIAEEVSFRRGVMGSLLATRRYRRYALVISAAVFSIIHFNPAQIPTAFVAGLFLGWLYLRTHSLVLPILCHILNNSMSVALYWIPGVDADKKIIDCFPSTLLFACAMVLSLLILAVTLYQLKRITHPQPFPVEDDELVAGSET